MANRGGGGGGGGLGEKGGWVGVGGRWVGRRLGKEGGVIGRDYVRRDGKLVEKIACREVIHTTPEQTPLQEMHYVQN